MTILGIETSCDETAASVVEDGQRVLSNVVVSQIDLHQIYGGVVPEIAARSHIETILPVISDALEKAMTRSSTLETNESRTSDPWASIDAIAVANGPGLLGSLLIGTLTARVLALVKNKPLYGVNHVTAHAMANMLLTPQPEFPMLGLIVSGGHSQLVLFDSPLEYEVLGKTLDDAVGEAFDKVAKIIGLEYPGGPSIQAKAVEGNPKAYDFPKARLGSDYDFSFSGLKTAVLRKAQELVGKDFNFPSHQIKDLLTDKQVADLSASFQHTAVETLVDKAVEAFEQHQPKSVVIGGGVAANTELRRQLSARVPLDINYIDMSLCTDNAAMIAVMGYYQAKAQKPSDPTNLEVVPNLKM